MHLKQRILIGIDRDGTLIHDTGDFPGKDWPNEQFELLENVRPGLLAMHTHILGSKLVMITNQSGPSRGIVKEENLPAIHENIQGLLPVRLDGTYFCTHITPAYAEKHKITGEAYEKYVTDCRCRKPKPGMLEQASIDLFKVPLSELDTVYMIGDRPEDVQTALNAGAKGIGVYMSSSVNGHEKRLEEVLKLKEENPERVLLASSFFDAAMQVVNNYEYHKYDN